MGEVMKITANDNTNIPALLAAAKAALASGTRGVTIEITQAPVVEVIALTGQPFCPVVDCGECEFSICTSGLQRAGVMTVAEAQHEYDVAQENLKRAELNIQIAVKAHG